jgi:ArsR family transcriptional regulator
MGSLQERTFNRFGLNYLIQVDANHYNMIYLYTLEHIYVLAYICVMLNETDSFFKMLADSTRLRCLLLMQSEGELCVCELTSALNLSQPKISRHLAHLRESGILVARRNGTWMYYRINPELQNWALQILQTTLDGVRKTEPFMSDIKILKSMSNRPHLVCSS